MASKPSAARSAKKAPQKADPKASIPLIKKAQPRDAKKEMTRGNSKGKK